MEPNSYFKEKLKGLAPGHLLIPGEGEGRQALHAAGNGGEVTAFDISHVARKHALSKAAQPGLSITYPLSRAEGLLYEPVFHAAALIYFHLPAGIRSSVHGQIAACVKPGGHLLLEAFHPRQLGCASGGPKEISMLYTADVLAEDYKGWELLEKLEGEVLLQEGSGHKGKAQVTRLFARNPLM